MQDGGGVGWRLGGWGLVEAGWVGGCNKAECISHALKPQQLERAEERGEAGEVLQI